MWEGKYWVWQNSRSIDEINRDIEALLKWWILWIKSDSKMQRFLAWLIYLHKQLFFIWILSIYLKWPCILLDCLALQQRKTKSNIIQVPWKLSSISCPWFNSFDLKVLWCGFSVKYVFFLNCTPNVLCMWLGTTFVCQEWAISDTESQVQPGVLCSDKGVASTSVHQVYTPALKTVYLIILEINFNLYKSVLL